MASISQTTRYYPHELNTIIEMVTLLLFCIGNVKPLNHFLCVGIKNLMLQKNP